MRNCVFGAAPQVDVLVSGRREFEHAHAQSCLESDRDLTNAASHAATRHVALVRRRAKSNQLVYAVLCL